MVKETSDYLELVLKIFGVIGGVVTAFIFFKKWYKSYVTKASSFFSGAWSNEGIIDDKIPTHYIDLKLSCNGDEIDGYFNVRKTNEGHTWHSVSITGKRFFSSAKCKITHVRNGEVLLYGIVMLKKHAKKNLSWVMKKAIADFFPAKTILYKSLPTII